MALIIGCMRSGYGTYGLAYWCCGWSLLVDTVELGVSVTGAIGARGRSRTLVDVSRLQFDDDQTCKDPKPARVLRSQPSATRGWAAGRLGKIEAEREVQESCLGSRHVCPRNASASQAALSRRMAGASSVLINMCCLDGTIGAFPAAKLGQQMRLDSISAAVRVVGLQGRAKTFSNVWLFD